MELTGKLKEDVEKCETLDEAKAKVKVKEAGLILSVQELDSVVGGIWMRRPSKKEIEKRRHPI